MSARPNHRRATPARVRANLERQRSGAAGIHGCRTPRPTAERRAIAASLAGE